MKTRAVCLSLCLVLIGIANSVSARDMAIGLSPYIDAPVADTQIKSLLQFLSDTLEPGESCFVFDAYHLRSLGTFSVPDKSVYRNPKAKLQANRQVIATMLQFAKAARKPEGGNEPSVIGAIRLPQALLFIGRDYPVAQESDLILMGNPLYDDPKDQGFTMRHSHIPGDGHLTKTRSVSPFGIKGQDSLLAKRRVHMGFLDDSWKQGDQHSFFVHRFYTLFIEGQGGQLSTFTHDLPTLFQRIKTNAPSPKHGYKVEPTDKLEMILLRPSSALKQPTIYERPVNTTPLPASVLRNATQVEVGITWECACDLDLYGQREPGAAMLWYLNTQSSDGRYFKDFTNSPRRANGYETLGYHVPVDLSALLLAVNFYYGSSPGGVQGEIRISVNGGQTYAKPFHIPAQEGNGGLGRQQTLTSHRASNAQWLVIDPLEVLGIRASQTLVSQR